MPGSLSSSVEEKMDGQEELMLVMSNITKRFPGEGMQ
jgi:hypothetical protein